MHRVLITDDEQRDRNIIKILLERQYPGQFDFQEAENGREAVDLLAAGGIELLFLDINMPGLSGLDVLHHLKEMPYVIILTAYDNFSYTREALRCGVRDYLLKPPLRSEFYQAVDRFLEDSERVRESLSLPEQSRETFTRDLAKQLMYYGDPKKIKGLMDVTDILEPYALCGLLSLAESQQETALDEAEELLNRWEVPYAAAACGQGVAIFLFGGKKDTDKSAQLLMRLAAYLENNLCTRVTLQTGPQASVMGGYPAAFMRLLQIQQVSSEGRTDSFAYARLENAVRQQDFTAAMQAVQPLLEAFGVSGESEDLLKYRLLLALNQCSRQLLSGQEVNDAYLRISGLISAKGKEQATKIVACYLEWLLDMARANDSGRNNAVQAVLAQVNEDCSRPWSIDAFADHLHVNAGHLSRMFKECTGSCFTDYLAERRISRAVELMHRTDLRLSQIGEMVGYEDPNYFSRVFKKRKGVGPREFSKSLRTETGTVKNSTNS